MKPRKEQAVAHHSESYQEFRARNAKYQASREAEELEEKLRKLKAKYPDVAPKGVTG